MYKQIDQSETGVKFGAKESTFPRKISLPSVQRKRTSENPEIATVGNFNTARFALLAVM